MFAGAGLRMWLTKWEIKMRFLLLSALASVSLLGNSDFAAAAEPVAAPALVAPPTCTFVLGDPFDFSGQFTEIPIPNNETAELCVLTQVATATSSGGTGRCILRVTVDASGTKHWTMQMPGPAAGYANCGAVCVKSIKCR